MNTYKCAQCKETFINTVPEYVKIAEAERNFGKMPEPEDQASLCEDCYQWFIKIFNALSPEEREEIERKRRDSR